MKKIAMLSMAVLASLSLAACGNSSSKDAASSSSTKTAKVAKHSSSKRNAEKKKSKASKSSSSSTGSDTTSSSNTNQQSTSSSNAQSSSQGHQLTQGEINMQRGYDPNGNPLLPGQDHAAGSNPDGSPDAWVQGQIDWAKQNGYMNEDGSLTQKGADAESEVEANANPDDSY